MPIFKNQVKSVKLNTSASMDRRTNNELTNIGGQGDSTSPLAMYNLENASMFYDGALSSRPGSITLSNGLAGFDFNSEIIYNSIADSSIGYGVDLPITGLEPIFQSTPIDYPVQMFIPSGNYAMTSGTFYARGISPTQPSISDVKDMIFKSNLYELNQVPVPLSGTGFMSGNGYLHDLTLGGFYNVPPFPEYLSNLNPVPSGSVPIAISETKLTISGSAYTLDTVNTSPTFLQYVTPPIKIDWTFASPAHISSGATYAKRFYVENSFPIRDWNPPSFNILYHAYAVDNNPNLLLGQEFLYVGPPANQSYAIRPHPNTISGNTLKNTIDEHVYGYVTPGFLSPDDYTSDQILECKIKDTNAWNSDTTTLTESSPMGQLWTPPSGQNVYFGSYFYPSIFSSSDSGLKAGFFNNNGPSISQLVGPQNVGIKTELFKVISASGSTVSGTYQTNDYQSVAVGSGTLVMNFDEGYAYMPTYSPANNYIYGAPATVYGATKPNLRQQRFYLTYNNPVLIISSGNDQYINSFSFYDIGTGESSKNIRYNDTPELVYSAFGMGVQQNNLYSGSLIINNSGTYWSQHSGTSAVPNGLSAYAGLAPDLVDYDLNCGMIKITPNEAITLVYEYKKDNETNSNIIYGHKDKLFWSTFANPEKANWTQFHSGAAIDNNALWSATTMQNLLIAHQDGQSTGQIWDLAYSGNSYAHGLRPNFSLIAASGVASYLPSGTYQVMAAVSMESGGFRSSDIQSINIASGQWIEAVFTGGSIGAQYPFDINPSGVYLFATQPSGDIFYAPTLYSQVSGGSIVPQGFDNTTPFVAFNNIIPATDNDVPLTLEPPYPQAYLVTQIQTPQFTKVLNYLGYVLGVGASGATSAVYYSEINAPQIWGTAGDFHGSIDVVPEDGDIITSIERFKQYTIIFKRNSTYRMEFVEEGGLPFSVLPIDNTLGTLGTFSTVSTPEGVYGLSQQGPIICNGDSVKRIGQEIYPWYQTLDHNDLINSYALHDQPNNTITWSIGNDDANSSRNYGLVYNYRSNSWIIRRGAMWNCGNIVRDENNFDQIWIGDSLGQIKRDGVSNSDSDIIFADGNGVVTTGLIQMLAETPWMSYADSDIKKGYRFLVLNTEAALGSSLNIEVYLDYSTVPAYIRTVSLDAATPINRVNLGKSGRIVKFKIYNTGNPNLIKINKISLELQYFGTEKPASKFM